MCYWDIWPQKKKVTLKMLIPVQFFYFEHLTSNSNTHQFIHALFWGFNFVVLLKEKLYHNQRRTHLLMSFFIIKNRLSYQLLRAFCSSNGECDLKVFYSIFNCQRKKSTIDTKIITGKGIFRKPLWLLFFDICIPCKILLQPLCLLSALWKLSINDFTPHLVIVHTII